MKISNGIKLKIQKLSDPKNIEFDNSYRYNDKRDWREEEKKKFEGKTKMTDLFDMGEKIKSRETEEKKYSVKIKNPDNFRDAFWKKWQATYIAPLNHIPLLCSHPGGFCRSWSCRTCRCKYTIFLFFCKDLKAL